MGNGATCPGAKRPRREADHPAPANAEVHNEWNYTSIPPYVFMTWYLVKHREKCTFIYLFTYLFMYLLTYLLVYLFPLRAKIYIQY
jgi:hypothetical protein